MSIVTFQRLTIKKHDTLPKPKFKVVQKDPSDPSSTIPVDLTGATAKFLMVTDDDLRTLKVDAAATIISPETDGEIEYSWIAADTDTIGDYLGEVEIIFTGGEKLTLPNDDTFQIKVVADYNDS